MIVEKYFMFSVSLLVWVASICGLINVVAVFGSFLSGLGVWYFAGDIYKYYKARR